MGSLLLGWADDVAEFAFNIISRVKIMLMIIRPLGTRIINSLQKARVRRSDIADRSPRTRRKPVRLEAVFGFCGTLLLVEKRTEIPINY